MIKRGGHQWHKHPGVRSGDQLTLGERAADRMRNSFGSWTFIAATMLFIAAWIFLVIYVKIAIDNHQLTILNLILSCFAAMQGAIILLAAKRADAISSELALHTFENGKTLLDMNTRQLGILTKLDGLDGKVADLASAVQVVMAARNAPATVLAPAGKPATGAPKARKPVRDTPVTGS